MSRKKSGKPGARKPARAKSKAIVPVQLAAIAPVAASFEEVVGLIEAARQRAYQAVNTELITLYWRVGAYISCKIEAAEWGEKVVAQLAEYIDRRMPGTRGFSRPNLFRMKQFYEAYRNNPIVSPVVRQLPGSKIVAPAARQLSEKVSALLTQLPWTHHLMILARCKRDEEREFYIRLAIQERWSTREFERQLKSALFERAVLHPPKVAAVMRQLHPAAQTVFKDAYLLDFLDLPKGHSEDDLEHALVGNLRRFLIELGRDFCFVGEQYLLQVGVKDYRLDLLFYHRELQCLVAIELKIDEFRPEYLGKLEFYLEALDRNVKKPHERPTIGVLLCATKNSEVVEYALSRSLSPALIAEYQTRLPDKKLLQAKLHEFYSLAQAGAEAK